MRPLALTLCALFALPALADEIVNTAPSERELGRYAIARAVDVTVRIDSATGASWFLCSKKGKPAWCKSKELPSLPAGPAGRYRVVEASPLLMIDSVTGRSWVRCELPTPEKGFAWCALEE